MLVTLTSATSTYFETQGLIGFLNVALQDGTTKLYVVRFPTSETPDPPGWRALVTLTDAKTEDVIAAWDGDHNPIAVDAMVAMSARVGEKFIAAELDSHTVALTPLDGDDAMPIALPQLEPEPAVATVMRNLTELNIEQDPVGPAYLVVSVDGVLPANWLRFRAPDANEHHPPSWWVVEALTGVAAERVVSNWSAGGANPALTAARDRLSNVLRGRQAPVFADGTIDLDGLRKQVVRAEIRRTVLDGRPTVFLGRPLHTIEYAHQLLSDAVGEYLYRTQASPVMVKLDDNGKKIIAQSISEVPLARSLVQRYLKFARPGYPPRYVEPPKTTLEDIIHFPRRQWPELRGIVRIPVLRPDGTVLDRPGYDAQTQLWYAPEFALRPIPTAPTAEDITVAKALLEYPIQDFPFVHEAGAKAAFMCCLFDQICLPLVDGPRPFFVFTAPENGQGTGKTLLAQYAQTVNVGEPQITPLPKKDEEIEKSITSLLREGVRFVVYDNLEGTIKSSYLATLGTSVAWRGRVLGVSEAPSVRQQSTWCFTLNKARFSEDLGRRTVMIALDAKVRHAARRTGWAIESPLNWARARRPAVIRAMLVLARAWALAGRPASTTAVMGTFESWLRNTASIVTWAGWTGLDKALAAVTERGEYADDNRDLIRSWLALGGFAMSASRLADLAMEHGLYEPLLRGKTTPIAKGKVMAKVLRDLTDEVIEGVKLKTAGLKDGYPMYVIEAAN